MSTVPSPLAPSSKASAPSGPASPAQGQPTSASANFFGQQRGTAAGGTRSATPRSNQQGKKQHKGSKRFRQPDEDAIEESVSLRTVGRRSFH